MVLLGPSVDLEPELISNFLKLENQSGSGFGIRALLFSSCPNYDLISYGMDFFFIMEDRWIYRTSIRRPQTSRQS